jgi:hypothetical protein
MTIHIPEAGWSGNQKKVEIRDEKIIRAVFQYAELIGTDFTEAMRRALLISLPLVIENEKLAQARLAACFTEPNNFLTTPTHHQIPQAKEQLDDLTIPAPNIYSVAATAPAKSSKPKPRSAGDLI